MSRTLCLILILNLSLISCGGGKTEAPKVNTYKQDFKTNVAWIVLEWNGQPGGYGSGFLIDREKGAFYTNKHVSKMFDGYGKGSHKIFFNGKVYNAEIVQTPPLVDAALVRITDKFDPSEFPEPIPVSDQPLKLGDRMLIEGFHPHPQYIRESDEAEGYKYKLVPIFRDYYNRGTRNIQKETEIVFERLEGKVTNLSVKAKLSGSDLANELRNETNRYIEVKTVKDHKFSFGGMSGTMVRDSSLKIAGIVTIERTRFDYDKKQLEETGFAAGKQVFDTIFITPIQPVEVLRKSLE